MTTPKPSPPNATEPGQRAAQGDRMNALKTRPVTLLPRIAFALRLRRGGSPDFEVTAA